MINLFPLSFLDLDAEETQTGNSKIQPEHIEFPQLRAEATFHLFPLSPAFSNPAREKLHLCSYNYDTFLVKKISFIKATNCFLKV